MPHKSDDLVSFTITALAKACGKDRKTIVSWLDGLDHDFMQGKREMYYLGSIIEFLKKSGGSRSGEDRSKAELETQLVAAKLEAQELKNAKERGELVESALVVAEWSKMVSNARSKLLSLPSKTAHLVMGVQTSAEAQEIIKQAVHEALTELADGDYMGSGDD